MPAAEVVGEPPADRVELDAAADAPAVAEVLDLLEGQHLRLQELQLQRHQQSVLGAAGPEPDEALAGDEHLAGDHALQAVEVGQPVGVGLVGPGEPEPLHPVADRRAADALVVWQRLRQREDRRRRQEADPDQRPEDRLPGGVLEDLRSGDRPKERSDGHHRHQRRKHPGRVVAGIEIAHHRTGQRHPGAGAERLHHAPADDLPSVGREGAAGRADHEHQDAEGHRHAAPVAIAERPPEQLPDRETRKVPRDRPLQGAVTGAQVRCHGRQGWQVEIGRDRGKAKQHAEDREQPEMLTRGVRCCVGRHARRRERTDRVCQRPDRRMTSSG